MVKSTFKLVIFNLLLFIPFIIQAQQFKMAVISDLHYFDPALIIEDGKALNDYVDSDRKMIRESDAILNSVLDSIKLIKPDFLLISGDLTKDGEKSSHQKLALKLSNLENSGIKVYVCPGNHDINNPGAQAYNDSLSVPVDDVSPADFLSIYSDFGYSEAIYTDNATLSYIAQPINGLWLLSIDACHYQSNFSLGYAETKGSLPWSTRQWIKEKLKEASKNNIKVIAFMHHNLLEHFTMQKTVFSAYVIEKYDSISAEWAYHGLKVVFTGHSHAQDAVEKSFGKDKITDIQTGSLVTFPCPYRIAVLNSNQQLILSGKRVSKINYPTGSLTFQEYAYQFLASGTPSIIKKMLMSPPYSLNDSMASWLAPAVSETLIAHSEGNEGEPSTETKAIINQLKMTPYSFFALILESIWNDAAPDDWNLTIDLKVVNAINDKGSQLPVKLFSSSGGILKIVVEDQCSFEVLIYNSNGSLIKHSKVKSEEQVNFESLSSGIYLVKIIAREKIYQAKVLVQ